MMPVMTAILLIDTLNQKSTMTGPDTSGLSRRRVGQTPPVRVAGVRARRRGGGRGALPGGGVGGGGLLGGRDPACHTGGARKALADTGEVSSVVRQAALS